MAPTRKSRSVNKRFTNTNAASPPKDEGTPNKIRQRKKLTDMLGPPWTKEELQQFYEAYRKFGKDWKRVAMAVSDRTVEMVESLYTMNRAYLSLPEGTASVVGLTAMMTDHYAVMGGSDSEQESNDGIGMIQKPQKRGKAKVRSSTTREADRLGVTSQSQTTASTYGCLSLLKMANLSDGRQVRAVGKRTPRVPVKYNYDRSNREKYISSSRRGGKAKVDAEDDDVAHEVALALAVASHRDGSPQMSYTPSKRKEASESEMTSSKKFGNVKVEEGGDASLGSTEAFNGPYSGRSSFDHQTHANTVASPRKGKKSSGKKRGVAVRYYHVDDVKEASSGTGHKVSGVKRKLATEFTGSSSLSSLGPKKRSKKVLFGGDEESAFDALQTLADISLMMPETDVELGDVQVKEEKESASNSPKPREIAPGSQLTEKSKALSRKKGDQSPTIGQISKADKCPPPDVNNVPEAGLKKRKHKSPASKIKRSDVQMDANMIEIQKKESLSLGKKAANKSKRLSRHTASESQVGPLERISEHSSSNTDVRREGDSAVSSSHAQAVDQVMPIKLKSRRKVGKAQIQRNLRDFHSSDALINVKSKAFRPLHHNKEFSLRLEKLYNSLSNHHVRRWCIYEWFYSAIDYPWFSKSEFVEYLYHVGLGHVPRLTPVEWGVIRSSLGKPRRFSNKFLNEEREKLYHYRDSVRSHYIELHMGTKDGLPTDLAPPLTVGQRVVAIHPRTREIHNGNVLTVDHDKCRVQFDLTELGVETVLDIDCMPLALSQNLPVAFNRRSFAAEKFFESLNLQNINVREEDRKHEYIEYASIKRKEKVDGSSHAATFYPVNNLLKQRKEASPCSAIKVSLGEMASPQHGLVSQASVMIQVQAKEADIRALADLDRALDRKNALLTELKRMNDDVCEDNSLRGIDSFKKQYAAVLVQLDQVFDQVSSALLSLRERNTYPGYFQLPSQKEKAHDILPLEHAICDAQESASRIYDIVETSTNKARKMVDAAMQAMSTLTDRASSIEKIEEAIDYVNLRLSMDDSASKPTLANKANGCLASQSQPTSSGSNVAADNSPDSKVNEASDKPESHVPTELMTKCVATLLMIQKCTERQFPPSDVARVLDLAVTGLQPYCSQNLPLYADIQKCMGIIRNQILALVPT